MAIGTIDFTHVLSDSLVVGNHLMGEAHRRPFGGTKKSSGETVPFFAFPFDAINIGHNARSTEDTDQW